MITPEEYMKKRGLDLDSPEIVQAREKTIARKKTYELREARKAKNLTQKELSEEMGISQKRVSELENGKLEVLKIGTLQRYVHGLGGEVEIIIKFDDDDQEIQLIQFG